MTLLLRCCLLVSLCFVSACASKTVQVSSPKEFASMVQRIAPLLHQKNIIDAQGNYMAPFFNSLPTQVGETLYSRLSPAFRFKLDPNLLPPTFKDSKTPADTLELSPQGFKLTQGSDTIQVELLAIAEWDNYPNAWIVLCRVNSFYHNTLLDYYLLIPNPEAEIFKPKLIAIYDCRNLSCQLYMETNTKTFDPEIPIIEREAGEAPITLPPSAPKPPAPAPTIREQKISG